jgi:Na+/H+-dicarboxylate symporter
LAPAGRHFTAWSLAALVLGLGLGIALHGSQAPWVGTLDNSLKPIGRLWIAALQLTVVPLIFTQVVVAVMRTDRLGALGAKTMGLFLVMLVAAGLFTLLIAPPLVALYPVDPAVVAALRAGVSAGGAARTGAVLTDRMLGFIPAEVSRFFLGGNPLPLLLGAIVLALVARRFTGRRRELFQHTFQRLSDATMRVVGWILLIAPLGVLALTFGLARSTGGVALSLLIAFVLIISGVTLLFTVLLYPVTAVLGGISMRQFARAVAPAQLVAASTRSSLAALAALVEGGKDRLGLPVAATGFVIPLAVATVKVSRMTTTMVALLFLAHAFNLPLGAERIVLFGGTVLLLSFIVAGLPGRGPEANILPAYVAAGVPLEGVIVLEAVDAIPDIFKTILNVTSIMSAAAIVAPRPRGSGDP